ncbi:MAG: hypothetical protein R2811_02760 [Flavobacteriales bacterium]
MPPPNPRQALQKFIADHPDLHEELFHFVDPYTRDLAIKDVRQLPAIDFARLADQARHLLLTRILHQPASRGLCRGKVIYTEDQANRKAKEIWNTGRGRMRVYRCPLCQDHHLTHKSDRFQGGDRRWRGK